MPLLSVRKVIAESFVADLTVTFPPIIFVGSLASCFIPIMLIPLYLPNVKSLLLTIIPRSPLLSEPVKFPIVSASVLVLFHNERPSKVRSAPFARLPFQTALSDKIIEAPAFLALPFHVPVTNDIVPSLSKVPFQVPRLFHALKLTSTCPIALPSHAFPVL